MTHTILAEAGATPDCVNNGTFNDNGYNLFEDASCISVGTSISGSPGLVPAGLADNGGLTFSIALSDTAKAKDAGDPSISLAPMHDQRGPGFPRIVGGRIDIGAYEYDVGRAARRSRLTPLTMMHHATR